MNFVEFFTPAAIAANYTEVASNAIPYLGTGFFPAKKKSGLDLKWLKGSKGLPVSLMPSHFDAKATFRERVGIKALETEMPFFREGFKIKEIDRQEILRAQDSKDPYAAEVINRIFDDANTLLEGAAVVPERMIMQLLFSGKIQIKANGVDYDYNYDQDGSWAANNIINATVAWSNAATADPFADFKRVTDYVASSTGSQSAVAIMDTATFNQMGKTDAVKTRYLTTSGLSIGYLTNSEIASVVQTTTGLQIVIYDKQYKNENGVAAKFIPTGYVAIVPAGALGSTWYGTTPEEADLMGSGKAEVSIVNTGVAITRVVDEHPVNINTFASEIVLPSWERMDECAVLKVN